MVVIFYEPESVRIKKNLISKKSKLTKQLDNTKLIPKFIKAKIAKRADPCLSNCRKITIGGKMGKSKEVKKALKKKPAKTLKEKRAAKREKKKA